MKRRDFAKTVGVGLAGAAGGALVGQAQGRGATPATPAAPAATQARKPVLLKLGCQSRTGTSKDNLEFLARHGVYHMDPGDTGADWTLETVKKHQEEAAAYGISIGAYHLPLGSGGIDRIDTPNIMLGKSPERDREIERIQQIIAIAGRAGVPCLLYNMTILPVTRTGRTADPKRGNASYSTWNQQDAYARGLDKEMTIAGKVDIDTIYERIKYFLDRVLPVALEYKVRLANHIADPPLPVGYRGITRWNSPDVFEGLKRYAALSDNPYHGFNLCVGSVGEGLKNPATEIFPILEYLGSRRKIFNVHLRNIKGGWGNFMETYPDNGDMNFISVMRTLRDVGYDGMVMPDHVPQHPAPGSGDQAFTFAYGYIRAMIQLLEMEAQG